MTEISKIQVGQNSYEIKDEKAARISHTHKTSEIAGLSTVATSGNYSDLKGKPSAATENVEGLMSAADKKRLDGIANIKEWVESRGQNLVSNGYATLGNNTNFSDFTFDGADAFQSGGSFSYKATYPTSAFTNELMPYDPSIIYKLSYYIKSDYASAHYYDILDCYDIDGNQIIDAQVEFVVGSTTTLVADLKPGDTSVSVESAAGFNSSDSDGRQSFNRGLMFWNYANSFGYTYPPETYTRNRYDNLWTKNSTAINKTSNRITLDKAWSGPTIPKGTSVSQKEKGCTFIYGNANFTVTANEWTHKECTFKNKARPGTAYVKIGWLIPNDLGGASSVTTKLTGVSFGAEYATQASLNSYKTTNDQAVAAAKKAGTDAQATANTANTNANTALTTANRAITTANNAVTTANGAKSTADATAALIRPYAGGALVAKTGAKVGALVNANGSFDVVSLTWTNNTPNVSSTLSSLDADSATEWQPFEVTLNESSNLLTDSHVTCMVNPGLGLVYLNINMTFESPGWQPGTGTWLFRLPEILRPSETMRLYNLLQINVKSPPQIPINERWSAHVDVHSDGYCYPTWGWQTESIMCNVTFPTAELEEYLQ